MDGVRFLGRTSGKMDDYALSTPSTTEGPAYECCEMKTAAFVGLGCIMALLHSLVVLLCFIMRKRTAKQNMLNKQTSKMSGSQTQP